MGRKDWTEKMQLREAYGNNWHTDLMNTLPNDPAFFCFSCFCAPCSSFLLRRRALYNDLSRYLCCGGYMPCSGHCGERKCPAFCLAMEVFFCFGNSVASTRFLLQDEFNIQTTPCDNCIIGFMICVQQLACICSIIACLSGNDELQEASEILNCIADYVYCTVCACMQTQHKVEMDKRDGLFQRNYPMEAPQVQQMSRDGDEPAPPVNGYPVPPPTYGPPPPGYPPSQQGYPAAPPPQSQQYPAQGYPPAPGHPPSGNPPPQK